MSTVDIDKLLDEAQLPKRVVLICLRGDLTAEAQRIEAALKEAETSTSGRRLTGDNKAVELAEALESVQEQMKAASIEFELEAFPGYQWRALKSEHPVSDKPTQADAVLGADTRELFNAAVPLAVKSPEMNPERWDRLLDKLPDGEWHKLVDAVYLLNEEGTSLPFSSRAFAILRARSDESESPETSE